jgi:hypothetical protein
MGCLGLASSVSGIVKVAEVSASSVSFSLETIRLKTINHHEKRIAQQAPPIRASTFYADELEA